MTKMNAAVAAAAAKAVVKPFVSKDKLIFLRGKIAEARDIELMIKQKQEELRVLSNKLQEIQSNELPALFDELQIRNMTLEASGNLPAYEARLETKINASLPTDERREQALKKLSWLGELAKNTFMVQLGKGDEKRAKKLASMLKKSKFDFEQDVKVHAGTLTAEVRRRYRDGQPLSQATLDLIGAFVRPIVTIDKVKEKK